MWKCSKFIHTVQSHYLRETAASDRPGTYMGPQYPIVPEGGGGGGEYKQEITSFILWTGLRISLSTAADSIRALESWSISSIVVANPCQ